MGLGGWPFGTKSEGVGLIVRAISFQDFQTMSKSQTNGQTDRQTDGQTTTCNHNTALCTIVHRAVKTVWGRVKRECGKRGSRMRGNA